MARVRTMGEISQKVCATGDDHNGKYKNQYEGFFGLGDVHGGVLFKNSGL